MPTLITAFVVPPDADEAFVSEWEPPAGCSTAALHRALREDVDFRFVEVAQVDAPREGVYEVVREDATPDVEGGVVLINLFEVPEADDERFLAGWDRARDALADQRGYLGTRLHRSVGAAEFRFVNIARWSSPLMFSRALQRPEFQQAAAMPFPAHPALYQVVRAT
jgi:heme-degrading monooxygenase HmoA